MTEVAVWFEAFYALEVIWSHQFCAVGVYDVRSRGIFLEDISVFICAIGGAVGSVVGDIGRVLSDDNSLVRLKRLRFQFRAHFAHFQRTRFVLKTNEEKIINADRLLFEYRA